ncbi:MAG: NAD(P)H-quinone oxidoreductase subunit J, chloroplastic [Phycisphaerae bacterium]|nr:NAD(P)H-quinone oxidoreductase subunit J, chloroplastic [Phycisphaerae bacterium]
MSEPAADIPVAPGPLDAHPGVKVLRERFGDAGLDPRDTIVRGRAIGMPTVTLARDVLEEAMGLLKSDPRAAFDQLTELTCVDYLKFPQVQPGRFGVTYGLLSTTLNHRLWAKVFVNESDLSVPSVTSLWKGANWLEREVFDLFGVVFEGHPDLRRILTPAGFKDFPLRKDFPLTGKGWRESFRPVTRDEA